jgi:hypothetical protein
MNHVDVTVASPEANGRSVALVRLFKAKPGTLPLFVHPSTR